MSSILYTFDPSTVATGFAIFQDAQLRLVHVIRAKGLDKMIENVKAEMIGIPIDAHAVVETPTTYKHDKAPPKVVRQLIHVAGACRAHFTTSTSVKPAEWNHGIPKEITAKRTRALLSKEEWAIVRVSDMDDNAWDAIGLGMWYLKRSR
jgi:hypothetical protein